MTTAIRAGLVFFSLIAPAPAHEPVSRHPDLSQIQETLGRKVGSVKTVEKKQTITIGLGIWAGFGPLYLAQQKGYFKEEGVDVKLISLPESTLRYSGFSTGQIQALAAPVDYFALLTKTGQTPAIVMAIDESYGGDALVVKKGIASVKDLKGKTVAYQAGFPGEFFLRVILAENGMSMRDITRLEMFTALASKGFVDNKIDAAMLWEPFLTEAVEKGGGASLVSTKDHPDLIVDVLGFSRKTIEDSPRQVQGVVNAVLKAIRYAADHPKDAYAIMAPYFSVSPDKYEAIVRGIKFCDQDRNRDYFGRPGAPGPLYRVVGSASSILVEAGTLKAPVRAESLISPRFVAGSGADGF